MQIGSSNVKYNRIYNFNIPKNQSIFLWGARKVGITTFLKDKYPDSFFFDFLNSKNVIRYSKEPYLLREEILALPETVKSYPIIIDEVQKVPEILDEIHWLIENEGLSFILCGSSTRSLRRAGVNLLGGRAWSEYFYPLVYPEIDNFDLIKILNRGAIPAHYASPHYHKLLGGYVVNYLTEEIKNEGLIRNLPAFSRFLESLAFTTSGLVNYANIGRDCGVSSKTVREYFSILQDTLLGYLIDPFTKNPKRNIITSFPKFYLFDVGILNYLCDEKIESLQNARAGQYFENYMFQELMAYNNIKEKNKKITFWRTRNGTEVDFIIGSGEVAIEVKISNRIRKKDLNSLALFGEDFSECKLYVVSTEPNKRVTKINDKEIMIYPYDIFLKDLWSGKVF